MQESLQSRRYELFRRLGDKLLLETGEARGFPPLVSRQVVAVIDASELLLDQTMAFASVDIQASAGAYTVYFTVPVGERWHLIWINREATTANTHVEINKSVADLNQQLSLDGTSFEIIEPKGIRLEANDTIGMITTGNAADSAIFMNLTYDRELVGESG